MSESSFQNFPGHEAIFYYGAVRFASVWFYSTAPHRMIRCGFTEKRTAPYDSASCNKTHRTAPYDSKKQINTEPRSGLGVCKTKCYATVRVRCSAVLNIFYQTAPQRINVAVTKPNRTAP